MRNFQPVLTKERHYRIHYGATGYSYETIFKDYLPGAEEITAEDPYIRAHHQIVNFLRFCETVVKLTRPKRIVLITNFEDQAEKQEAVAKLSTIADSLKQFDVQLDVRHNARLHDREVRLSSGWTIKIGRGFDIYQVRTTGSTWARMTWTSGRASRPALTSSQQKRGRRKLSSADAPSIRTETNAVSLSSPFRINQFASVSAP